MKITIPSRLTEAANNPINSSNNTNTNINTPTASTSSSNAPPNSVHSLGSLLFHTLRDAKKDGRPLAFEFQHLPPRSHFPDYYALIKKPLSFAEIRAKLERRDYTSLKQVSDDFHTMFMNAKKYNVKGSGIYTDAKKLDKLNRTTYERLMGVPSTGMPASAAGQAKDSDGEVEEASPQLPPAAIPTPTAPPLVYASSHVAPPGYHKRVYRPEYTSTGELINPPTPAGIESISTQRKKKAKLEKAQAQAQASMSASTSTDKKGDDKPPTLTKWLTAKLDDLSELTDTDGRRLADVFVQLPRKDLYPDYYQLISKPVSLHLVRSRLKNRNYPTIASFIADVSTIFSNAQFYNQEESLIYSDSVKMNNYFNEIMKEEPPEFSVRPRKTDKQHLQQQGRQSPFPVGGAGTPTTETMRLDLGGSQNAYNGGFPTGQSQSSAGSNANHLQQAPSSGISFDLGGMGGIENIQFQDTFDDQEQENDRSVYERPHQPQQQQQIKREDSQSALAAPQSAPQRIGLSPLATASNQFSLAQYSKATTPRAILKPSSLSQPPTIVSFHVRFMRYYTPGTSAPEAYSSSYTFHNHVVRSHAYTCAKEIDCVEVKAKFRPDLTSLADLEYGLAVRPETFVQMPSAESGSEEDNPVWAVKLSDGLNTIEITLGKDEELYRLFINRNG